MQCLRTFNAVEVALAYPNTPRLIADIDKDIVPAYVYNVRYLINDLR